MHERKKKKIEMLRIGPELFLTISKQQLFTFEVLRLNVKEIDTI